MLLLHRVSQPGHRTWRSGYSLLEERPYVGQVPCLGRLLLQQDGQIVQRVGVPRVLCERAAVQLLGTLRDLMTESDTWHGPSTFCFTFARTYGRSTSQLTLTSGVTYPEGGVIQHGVVVETVGVVWVQCKGTLIHRLSAGQVFPHLQHTPESES